MDEHFYIPQINYHYDTEVGEEIKRFVSNPDRDYFCIYFLCFYGTIPSFVIFREKDLSAI